jgi:Homeodomain-like domain
VNGPADHVEVSVNDAARLFRVSRSTVWSWVRRYGIASVGEQHRTMGGAWVKPVRLFRYGDLARAEQQSRTSGKGRPRQQD